MFQIPVRGKREILAEVLHYTGVLRLVGAVNRRRVPRALSVLAYHRIASSDSNQAGSADLFSEDVVDAGPARFRRQVEMVAHHGNVISLEELRDGLDHGAFPRAPVMITFDDGYRSCVDIVLPILEELHLKATFFLSTRFVEDRRLSWWDRIHYLVKQSVRDAIELREPHMMRIDRRDPDGLRRLTSFVERARGLDVEAFLDHLADATGVAWSRALERSLADGLILTWDDVERLRLAGMAIAAHTREHRVLQTLSPADLDDELQGGREDLRRHGVETTALAYPSGYPVVGDARLTAAVRRAGYDLGFTFGGGLNRLGAIDPLDIRRMPVNKNHSDAMLQMQLTLPSLGYVSARAQGF